MNFALSKACLDHWGLTGDPFADDGPFADRTWTEYDDAQCAYSRAIAVLRRRGMFVLYGATGSGKSVLAERILSSPDLGQVRVARPAHLNRGTMGVTSLQIAILRDILIPLADSTGVSRRGGCAEDVSHNVRRGLIALRATKILPVLFADDAEGIAPQMAVDFKRLWTLWPQLGPLIGILIVGQPGFHAALKPQGLLKQFANRCRHARVDGLSPLEIMPFLDFRLGRVGGKSGAIFTESGRKRLLEILADDAAQGETDRVGILDVQRWTTAALDVAHQKRKQHVDSETFSLISWE